MNKIKSVNKSVYELAKENPEIIQIMNELGFTEITKPGMLNTAGRFMTLQKGAAMKGISLNSIKARSTEKGYDIVD